MKKTLLLTVLFGTQAVFAADCPPAESIDFSGIHLGADKSSVLKVFPNAGIMEGTPLIDTNEDAEKFEKAIPGFDSGFFTLDDKNKISTISLSYTGKITEAPVEKIRAEAVKRFKLPVKGWKTESPYKGLNKKALKKAGYDLNSKNSRLVCKDYTVEIHQDFGTGKNTTGTTLSIYYNDAIKPDENL